MRGRLTERGGGVRTHVSSVSEVDEVGRGDREMRSVSRVRLFPPPLVRLGGIPLRVTQSARGDKAAGGRAGAVLTEQRQCPAPGVKVGNVDLAFGGGPLRPRTPAEAPVPQQVHETEDIRLTIPKAFIVDSLSDGQLKC